MAETAQRWLIERRSIRAAQQLDLFTPWQRLSRHMALSSGAIQSRLETIEELLVQEHRALPDVFKLVSALSERPDRSIFYAPIRAIVRSALIAGFNDGSHYLGRIPRAGFVDVATAVAAQRAKVVDRQMLKTTKRQLLRTPSTATFILSQQRADRAVRYEAAVHYNKGLLTAMRGSGVHKAWITTGDKPCPECIDNEDVGFVGVEAEFPSGDLAPLAHLNCFAGDVSLLASGLSRMYRRWYDGKMLRLCVKGDRDVFVTLNHPILTQRGWVAAANLLQSDYLLKCVDNAAFNRIATRINPNDQQVESMFEDCFDTAGMAAHVMRSQMPSTSEDFHGDGVVDEEVDVVTINGVLSDYCELSKGLSEGVFVNRTLARDRLALLTSSRLFAQRFLAAMSSAYSIMCSMDGVLALSDGHLLPSDLLRFAVSSRGQPKTFEPILQRSTRDTETLSDVLHSFSGCMQFVQLAELAVIEDWKGHVYNAETRSGWYGANGIVSHNCQCVLTFQQ